MQSATQLRVEDLLSQLPGTVRRGHVPTAPGQERLEGKSTRLSTGYPEIDDLLGGGLPRGRLSELIGQGTVGVTSLVQRVLAETTAQEHFAAWIDVPDAFDPASASAAGVALHRLLWVRPPSLVAAFSAAEILLATGGFALVLLDTAQALHEERPERRGAPGRRLRGKRAGPRAESKEGRRMLAAPQTWLRLARAAMRSQTALVVLPGAQGAPGPGAQGRRGFAGAAAGVRLELSSVQAVWEGAPGAPSLLEGLETRVDLTRHRTLGAVSSSQSRRARIRLG